MAFESQYATSY